MTNIKTPDRAIWEGRLRDEEGAMFRVVIEYKDTKVAEEVCKLLVKEAREKNEAEDANKQ